MKNLGLFLGMMLFLLVVSGCDNSIKDNLLKNGGVNNDVKKTVSIDGKILFSGLEPDPGDTGEIILQAREHGVKGDFKTIKPVVKPKLISNSAWVWDKTTEGKVYDLRANLIVDGKDVARSDIVTTSAPATNIELPLRVTWSALPTKNRLKSFQKVGGEVKTTGYIPTGATITIYVAKARDDSDLNPEEVDDPQFQVIAKGVKAMANRKWYWSEALGKVEYLVKAELFAKNEELIGVSDIVRVLVPENNRLLNIKSMATAPEQKSVISGIVNLRGSYKSDSEVVISVRKDGRGGFKDIVTFPAESKRVWKFIESHSGQQYDVKAILKHKGKEVAHSRQKHIIAPSGNVKLKIDTGLKLSDPQESPFVVECKKKSSKKYDVKLTFPGIGDARAYWVRVGTKKYSGNRFNEPEKTHNVGDDLSIKLRINKKKDYYVDYSYSYCKDCLTKDSFSDFSPRLKFSCP